MLQRVFLVPTVDDPEAGDRVTGRFAVDFIMLFFHLSCIGIVIAYWIRGRRILNAPPGLLLGAFVLALGVSNLKAGIFYLVAMLGFLVLRGGAFAARIGRGRLVLASVALPALALGVFTPIYDSVYEKRENDSFAEMIFNPAYIQRYMFGDEKTQFTPAVGRCADAPWRSPGSSLRATRCTGVSGWVRAPAPRAGSRAQTEL